MTTVSEQITSRLQAMSPEHFEVHNESHMHNVPEGSESHFKVVIVTDRFASISRVQRHRMVNEQLGDLLAGPVHALAVGAYTQEEWQKRNQASMDSPDCLGGGRSK